MAYIGVSPSNGVRQKHTYTVSGTSTNTFSGAGAEGISLSYLDSNYVDVYQNGVKLGDADYTANNGTSIVLGTNASDADIVEIVVYDVFSVADTVSKADGGTFDGNVTMAGTLGVTGETTLATHLNMGDGDIIKLGADADLQIYHDGSNSIVYEGGTGTLKLATAGGSVDIVKGSDSSETMAKFNINGAVSLYYDNAVKLATTSTGIDITDSSNAELELQTDNANGGSVVRFNRSGTDNSYIGTKGYFTGNSDNNLYLRANSGLGIQFYTNGNNERMRIDSSGSVGINTSSPSSGYMLHVGGSSGVHTKVKIEATTATGQAELDLSADPAGVSYLNLGDEDSYNIGYLGYFHSDNSMRFQTNSAERMRINSNGRVRIGGTDQDGHLHVFGNFAGSGSSGYSAVFHNDGNNSNRYGILSKSGADDASGTNYAFEIQDGNGTLQGAITFSGGTVSYGAFTAYHPCIIPNADNDADSTANAYPYGTLLEITSLSYTQKNDADTERGIRYNVQKSSSAKSKAVLGAYGSSMNGGPENNTNMHQALILGDGHILCNNENGNIAVGDYICTSSTSGEGMKATSICTTIGIAREAITFTDSTAVLVAVEYGYRQFVPEDLEARIVALENA